MAGLFSMLGAMLSRLVSTQLGRWIMAAMAWLGITWATNQAVTEPLLANVQAYFSGIDSEALTWFAFFNMDNAITMVLGAYATRASIGMGKLFLAKRATA